LAEVLAAIVDQWPREQPKAADVTTFINALSTEFTPDPEKQRRETLRDFLAPNLQPGQIVTVKAVSKRLRSHLGEPVAHGGQTLILRSREDLHTKVRTFWIE